MAKKSEASKAPGLKDNSDREFVITRVFDAPRELVFKMWTDPVHLAKWWGPDDFTSTIEQLDLRPGGVWKLIMHGPDGTDYRNESFFIEVVEPSLLVYGRKTAPKFQSTVTFEDDNGKTRVTMRQLFRSKTEYSKAAKTFGFEEGSKQMFNRLAEHIKSIINPK